MSEVLFFEKPGCVGNDTQKRLLRGLGHSLTVKDLLSEPWTAETLRPYFGEMPVADWFNQSAPKVKSGQVKIAELDEDQALALMLAEPLLIRRPLLDVEGLKQAGFEDGPVLARLAVKLRPDQDLQSCPMAEPATECEAPA